MYYIIHTRSFILYICTSYVSSLKLNHFRTFNIFNGTVFHSTRFIQHLLEFYKQLLFDHRTDNIIFTGMHTTRNIVKVRYLVLYYIYLSGKQYAKLLKHNTVNAQIQFFIYWCEFI